MNTHRLVAASLLSLFVASATTAHAATSAWAPTVGARYYSGHSAFDDLPFTRGDIGYVAGAEFQDQSGLLQILVSYVPELDGRKWRDLGREQVADYTITPELSLLLEDQGWRAGAGIMASYIATEDDDSDWTSLYYQFQMGYVLGGDRLKLSVKADYTFEGFGDLGDFDFSDIDFSVLLHMSF